MFKDPVHVNRIAKQKSFDKQNYENVLKYIIDINKFIQEIYKKKVNKELQKSLKSFKKQFGDQFQESFDKLEDCLKDWAEQNKLTFEQILDHKKLKQFNCYFPEIIESNTKKLFVEGFQRKWHQFQTESNLLEQITKKIELVINTNKQIISSELMGCQKRCFFCHSKCCLPNNEHQQCQTNFHYFNGYSGKGEHLTHKILFQKCPSEENLKSRWFSGKKVYQNGFKLLEEKAPNWIDNLKKAFAKGNQDQISIKEKQCAIAIKEILLKIYELNDNEEYDVWEEVSSSQRLHTPICIKGYLNLE